MNTIDIVIGPAVVCEDCMEVTPVTESPVDVAACPVCGSSDVTPADIRACSIRRFGPDRCRADTHDFAYGLHVVPRVA